MKSLITLSFSMFLFTLAVQAQNKVDNTINKANNSVNSVNNSVNNASATASNAVGTVGNTATQTKALADQVGGLFGAKKKPAGNVVIKVPGITRAKIIQLVELIKSCPGVNSSNVDYVCDDTDQSITVENYKGKLYDFLDDIEKKSPLVTDNNSKASKADNSITITGL